MCPSFERNLNRLVNIRAARRLLTSLPPDCGSSMAILGTCHLLVLLLNACLVASQARPSQGLHPRFIVPEITVENHFKSQTSEEALYPFDLEEYSSGPSLANRRALDSSWYTPSTQYQVIQLAPLLVSTRLIVLYFSWSLFSWSLIYNFIYLPPTSPSRRLFGST